MKLDRWICTRASLGALGDLDGTIREMNEAACGVRDSTEPTLVLLEVFLSFRCVISAQITSVFFHEIPVVLFVGYTMTFIYFVNHK